MAKTFESGCTYLRGEPLLTGGKGGGRETGGEAPNPDIAIIRSSGQNFVVALLPLGARQKTRTVHVARVRHGPARLQCQPTIQTPQSRGGGGGRLSNESAGIFFNAIT